MTDYSKKGHYYIEEPRFEMKKLVRLLPAGSKVLDMGAGNGNNTRFLLENGHSVTAVEPNPQAIVMLEDIQKLYSDKLRIIKGSVDTYVPTEKYDAVICCMVIHFLTDDAVGRKAIQDIQAWTRPGGFNLVTGYMSKQPLPADYSFLLKPRELSKTYQSWKIHWQEESFRLTLGRIYSLADVPRLILGRRGFKAARIIAQNSKNIR